jgi:uroporphyrinogen III methyltransferase/synthase
VSGPGTVYLVGAGPGDPGLLTVRGRELLANADVVFYDRLGTESVLPLCRGDARLVNVGKAPGRVAMTQDETNAALVEAARDAAVVVRLKGGDPFVFGRGGEEAETLVRAGIPFEVVPGITSAIAAPAYAGVPVTHRAVATSVTIVTGHEDPDKPSEQTDWEALARVPGTLVVLMGVGRIGGIAERLIAAGRPADQPVAVVRNGTLPQQEVLRATLGTVAERIAEARLGPPAVIVIGDVAALADRIPWASERPLAGRAVVVTRARAQASALSERLRRLGAEPIELPAIRIAPIEPGPAHAAALDGLARYDLLVLTSANGVDRLFALLAQRGADARALSPGTTVVAIGPGTAERLAGQGVRADLVPERYVAEGILEALAERDLGGASVLVARARGSRPDLVDGLRERGAKVDEVHLYEAVPETPDPALVDRALAADYLTFTASSTVTSFLAALDEPARNVLRSGRSRVVSIGPVTSATLRQEGMKVDVEAAEHDIPGLVKALIADAVAR